MTNTHSLYKMLISIVIKDTTKKLIYVRLRAYFVFCNISILKMKKTASILLFCLLLWGCKKPAGIEFRGIKNIKLMDLSGDTATVFGTFSFFNPNKYPIQLKKIDADVYANNQLLTHYNLDTFMVIPADTTFFFSTSLHFNRSIIFNNIADAFLKREILLQVKGKTKVGRSGIFVAVPFDVSTKQAIKF